MLHRTRGLLWTGVFVTLAGLAAFPAGAERQVEKKSSRPAAGAGPSKATASPSRAIGTTPSKREAAPAQDGTLQRMPGIEPGVAPSQRLRPIIPGAGQVTTTPNPGAERMPPLPEANAPPGPTKIIASTFEARDGWHLPHQWTPGGTVAIWGGNLGTKPGSVSLRVDPTHFPEYPNGVPLEVISWTDTQVKARVPSRMTGPLFPAKVALRLTRPDLQRTVEQRREVSFQVPVETKVLQKTDREVRFVSCSSWASSDSCNGSGTTMSGVHRRDWGSAGHGKGFGSDEWAIHLEDGWVFSRVSHFHKEITGDDDDYIRLEPQIPVGKTSWAPQVKFYVSSDDKISYGINVEVMRAKGY